MCLVIHVRRPTVMHAQLHVHIPVSLAASGISPQVPANRSYTMQTASHGHLYGADQAIRQVGVSSTAGAQRETQGNHAQVIPVVDLSRQWPIVG